MKRISLLAMAVALVMTLAECKKTETPTNENTGGKVHITLDVSSGAKVIISPETGGTAFEQGDKVLVANVGHYVGTLTYNKNLRKFDGDLDEGLNENDYLHFYLLGNKDTEENLDDATNRPTTLTVNISDQTAAYPEIAYAPSTVKYTEGVTAYNARLLNKCALVKFTTNSISTSKAVTITGMNNKVAVNLGDNSFTYSKVDDGAIVLHAESRTERWAILLPQDEVTDATATAVGYATTPAFTVPEINENGYLDAGIAVTLVETYPEGAINGKFTVAEGKQVYFSQGNLQYIGSAATPYWKFAEHQWDYFGSSTDQSSNSETIDRDFFGWGTSGYAHRTDYYQPWCSEYSTAYAYPYNGSYNLYDQTGQADWGYNVIVNGGNQENSGWRTLTTDEWGYVFNSRTDAALKRGQGKVNSIDGIILLPDIWTLPDGLSFNPNSTGIYNNVYSSEQWTQMEANGAVFLPAAGGRGPNSYLDLGDKCLYWSSSRYNNERANCMWFSTASNELLAQINFYCYNGLSVRLVRNVQ